MGNKREMHTDSVDDKPVSEGEESGAEQKSEAAPPKRGANGGPGTREGAAGHRAGENEYIEYLDDAQERGDDFDPPVRPMAPSDSTPEATEDVSVELSEAQNQIETLTREKSAIYDQLLRRQAEFENFRKRLDRERGEIY